MAFAVRIGGGAASGGSYALIACYALLGRRQTIQAFFFSWLLTMLTPGIAPSEAPGLNAGRFLVLGAGMLSVFGRDFVRRPDRTNSWLIRSSLLIGGFLIVHSVFVSRDPLVSTLKVFSFTMTFVTLLSAAGALTASDFSRTGEFLFRCLVALVVLSVPLLVHPLGYLKNERGFQGWLGHPQAYGPTVALLGAWLVARIAQRRKLGIGRAAILALCVVSIISSRARTAGLSFLLGIAIPIGSEWIRHRGNIRNRMPGLTMGRVLFAGVVVITLAAVMGDRLKGIFTEFVAKDAEGTTIAEAAELSRGKLVDLMIENIKESPIVGIGFGVPSRADLAFEIQRDPTTGLPVSASVEKGVLPMVVLEELGVVGAIVVIWWLLYLAGGAGKSGPETMAILWSSLVSNLGESMFFSPGGMGLLLIVVVAWAVSGRGRTAELTEVSRASRTAATLDAEAAAASFCAPVGAHSP